MQKQPFILVHVGISLCRCGGAPHSVIITAEKLIREFNQLISESCRDEGTLDTHKATATVEN